MPLDFSRIYATLGALPERTERAVMAYGQTVAQKVRNKAVQDRPWTDRTGHARQRMQGDCVRTGTGIRVILAHGVSYGTDLEFGHEKRYAVIYPTLQAEAPGIMRGLHGLLDRAGGR